MTNKSEDFIRIGDYVKSNKYEGLTKSGVVIKKNQIDLFLDNVNKTLNTGLQTSMSWNNMENAELLIRKEEKILSSGTYYIDLRQFVKSKNFEGYTKKGLRMDEQIFKEFFEEFKSRMVLLKYN